MRGYAAIGLHNPKSAVNVGSVLRAAGCFGASMIAIRGCRYKRSSTDTGREHRKIPLLTVDDLHSVIPYGCVPVAIEVVDGARCLSSYQHPPAAFYVFGPEDGSLPRTVLDWCRDVVRIPAGCLNLAAATNVVLYDRVSKAIRGGAR